MRVAELDAEGRFLSILIYHSNHRPAGSCTSEYSILALPSQPEERGAMGIDADSSARLGSAKLAHDKPRHALAIGFQNSSWHSGFIDQLDAPGADRVLLHADCFPC